MARKPSGFNIDSEQPANADNGTAGQQPENFIARGEASDGVAEIGGSPTDNNGVTDGVREESGQDPNSTAKPRRRGRPPGSKNKVNTAGTGPSETPSAGRVALDVKQLAQKVQGLHAVAATLTGQPILMLQDSEAIVMAQAISDVAQHYNLDFGGPRAAVINLIAVMGMTYFPRVIAMRTQQATRQPPPQAARPTNVEETAPPPVDGVIDFSGAALDRALGRRAK